MSSTRHPRLVRRSLSTAVVAAASAAIVFGLPTGAGATARAGATTARAGSVSARALAFHDEMRALWESHGTWTERAIVDFVGGLPDTSLAIGRLLQNQTDIGNAVKPYYGAKGAHKLTALLKSHINAAVAVLKAAKSGDNQAVASAKAAFYANGNQVARFLHTANPRHWSLRAMKTMMRIHLDQVVALAVDQLSGRYGAAIRLYDTYINHILDMADMLSKGIIQQFPNRF
jgi:hypothetical protein